MDRDHTQGFNDRLSQWIASQGFWFQLRYSLTGASGYSSVAYQMIRLGVRLLIFCVVIGLAAGYYLHKRTSKPVFWDRISGSLAQHLAADKVTFQSQLHKGGELRVKSLRIDGSDESFFTALEAGDVTCGMNGLSDLPWLDRLTGGWNARIIHTRRLDMEFKPGYDSEEAAARGADILFRESGRFRFDRWEVADATLRWGYSAAAKGSIEHSAMVARRDGEAWKVELKGGYFRHGWLDQLEIINLSARCDRTGIVFDKAEFRLMGTPVKAAGLRLIAGERPRIEGTLTFTHLPVEVLLAKEAQSLLDGHVSGGIQLSGSINHPNGVRYHSRLELLDKDLIYLREDVPLLHALALIDVHKNFHRLAFNKGGLECTAHGSHVEISGINLSAGDAMRVSGQFVVRTPTEQEVVFWKQKHLAIDTPVATEAKEHENENDANIDVLDKNRKKSPQAPVISDKLFRKAAQDLEASFASSKFCEGELVLDLPANVFEKAPVLSSRYPANGLGRIKLMVPLQGDYASLTKTQADLMLEASRSGPGQ